MHKFSFDTKVLPELSAVDGSPVQHLALMPPDESREIRNERKLKLISRQDEVKKSYKQTHNK